MARPKKEKELRRTHPVMLRFTDSEYERLLFYAEAVRLPLAEYIRKQVTGKPVKVKYEIVADLPELKKLIAEFGKIGSNLNQIARHFNSGGIHSQEMRKRINQGISKAAFRQLSYFTQDQPWAVQLSPSGACEIHYGQKPGNTV